MPGRRWQMELRIRRSARRIPPCAARTSAGSPGSSARTAAGLGAVLALIVFSAALGVIPAFLLKEILNKAIPERDTTLLSCSRAG